jgi:hypothetical protein
MKRHSDCEELRGHLLDRMSAEKPLPENLAAHAQACTSCAADLESLRGTWKLLDAWPAPEPSPYFDSRLQARLREERANPQRAGFLAWLGVRWQPALAASLALTLALVLGLVGIDTRTAPPPQPSAAVSDLQNLDKNADVYNNFDLLYDDDAQQPTAE